MSPNSGAERAERLRRHRTRGGSRTDGSVGNGLARCAERSDVLDGDAADVSLVTSRRRGTACRTAAGGAEPANTSASNTVDVRRRRS